MKTNIILITTLLVITSCNLNNSRLIEINNEYKELLIKFDENKVSHFPERIVSFPYELDKPIKSNKILFLTIENRKLDTIINFFKKDIIAIYAPLDSCLSIVNTNGFGYNNVYEGKLSAYNSKYLKKYKTCSENSIPIPYFGVSIEDMINTPVGLPKDSEIYVFDAQQEKRNAKPIESLLPKGWEHGFSKGIVINQKEKSLMYWVIEW